MTAKDTVTFHFKGRFDTRSFSDFACQRAARLSLDARPIAVSRERISMAVSGQPELVDAFEMACSLGPIDCLVEDVTRHRDLMA
jgi:hypothetical protein